MFADFFFLLKSEGVPVSLIEWMTLMEALSRGMASSSLSAFYFLARAILVKSEAYYDQYDLAFAEYFRGVEKTDQLSEEILEWLKNPLPPLNLTPEERERLQAELAKLDLEELKRAFEERLRTQKGQHHGGKNWIGTGGTSPFGHYGYNPAGLRIGGESFSRSAVKVAGERHYKEYRHDETLGVRQFELALRRLRQFTYRGEGTPDELDLDGTIDATADNAGFLKLVYGHSRKNAIRVVLLFDVGGSMLPFMQMVNKLFSAVHRASHFKSLKTYYFHNCVYEHLYLDATCTPRNAIKVEDALRDMTPTSKLILVGDACMAPSELLSKDGIIWWGMSNEEPGIAWLKRLSSHFSHSAWLNPIPEEEWDRTYGYETIKMVREVFPMFTLTIDGLEKAVKKLLVKR